MDLCQIVLIILIIIIFILFTLVLILFLKYRKIKSKIYGEIEPSDSEENIDDKYFEERIENIKSKLK